MLGLMDTFVYRSEIVNRSIYLGICSTNDDSTVLEVSTRTSKARSAYPSLKHLR